ncbi:MAG: TIGR00730 family Rossman fold protein [Lachnospiraceae bacterium]|nr:TIGR00730 family Rossman fold protein [Lachnospiraceae bacterium]
MKIGVFLSSRMGKTGAYRRLTEELGRWLVKNGHELVYGGENYGLMAVLADTVLAEGGRAAGVIPNLSPMKENAHPGLQEYHYVLSMAERKSLMIKLADGFIALPGGIGTLDEFSEVLCLNAIGALDKPLVLLGTGGYYEPFRAVQEKILEERMADESSFERFLITEDLDEAGKFLARK